MFPLFSFFSLIVDQGSVINKKTHPYCICNRGEYVNIRVTTLLYTNFTASTLASTKLYCVLYRATHVFTYQINKTLRPFSINLHFVTSHHPATLCFSYVLIYLSFQRFLLSLYSLYTCFFYLSTLFLQIFFLNFFLL